MRGRYKAAVDFCPPPSRVALAKITAKREDLYQHVPLPGDPIPVGDILFLVDDEIP